MKICSNGHKTNSGWSPIINCKLYYKDATDDYFCIPFEGVFFFKYILKYISLPNIIKLFVKVFCYKKVCQG